MPLEFPYQIVAFLDTTPKIGEAVYGGKNGWYPQLAIKRRFKPRGIGEDELQQKLQDYLHTVAPLVIKTGAIVKPEHMPVKVVEVEQSRPVMSLHKDLIAMLGNQITSRYPERDGANYYPHITAEYDDKPVIDVQKYENREFTVTKLWLIKDVVDEDSVAHASYSLGSN